MLPVPGGTKGTMRTEKICNKMSTCFFICSPWKMYVLGEERERNPGQTSFTCWHGSVFVCCFMITHSAWTGGKIFAPLFYLVPR